MGVLRTRVVSGNLSDVLIRIRDGSNDRFLTGVVLLLLGKVRLSTDPTKN